MKRSGIGWPIGVVVTLAAVVVLNVWVAIIAGDDPSFAIEPDYYAKAIAWDSTMAQARRNDTLKWRLAPSWGVFSVDSGTTLKVRLTDSLGAPIRNANIAVSALYVGRAALAHTATLHGDGRDGYAVALPVDHAGRWELRFTVERGADRFTSIARLDASPQHAP
jgi:nitrogen fixation protein FixH